MKGEFEFGDASTDAEGTSLPVTVPVDLKYFEGHFPGNPLVPGVAQIVALVEAGARRVWPELGFSIGMRRVKFTHALRGGDALVLRLTREDGKVRFALTKGDIPCSKGALLFRT